MADIVQFDQCAEATAFGKAEAGRITGEILKRQVAIASPFRDRFEKEQWTDGVGYENLYKTYNPRIFEAITDDEMTPWNGGVNVADDGTGANGMPQTAACDPPLEEVGLMGEQIRKFGLRVKGFRTPLFCAFDLRTKHEVKNLLTTYYDTLAKNSDYFVERQCQNAYTRMSDNKIIANGNGIVINGAFNNRNADGWTVFPNVAPTSGLTQGLLDNICVDLSFAVTTAPNMLTNAGTVIYDLFTDAATSTSLVAQNQGIQQNVQYAFQGMGDKSPTINGVGAYMGRVINGFRHVYLKFPARWDLVGGQWVRIRPFKPNITAAELAAGPQNVTQEYRNAPFQDSYVFHTGVGNMVVQKAIDRIGPAHFGTPIKDYAGDQWQWYCNPGVNGCNLEGTKGFWWIVYRFGFKVIDGQVGYTIRHRRCGIPDSAYNCGPAYYGYTTDGGYGYAG